MAYMLKQDGFIRSISPVEQVTEKLTKQVLVLTVGDKYPEPVPFEFVNDRCDALHGLQVGEQVTVYFNLRGREWKDRVYGSLSGWKVETTGTAPKNAPAPRSQAPAQPVDIDPDLGF